MAFENELGQLRAISNSLHLLYHRNKNQHRRSKWWKWLTILRRGMIKLLQELQESRHDRFVARIIYFRDFLFPRCYSPFTQLIRDPQFSALGLVLVAELSELKRVIDVFIENDAAIKEQTARVKCDTPPLQRCSLAFSEDFGEIVPRTAQFSNTMNFKVHHSKELRSDAGPSHNDVKEVESSKGPTSTSKRTRLSDRTLQEAKDEERASQKHANARSQHKVNAIDRLFSGII